MEHYPNEPVYAKKDGYIWVFVCFYGCVDWRVCQMYGWNCSGLFVLCSVDLNWQCKVVAVVYIYLCVYIIYMNIYTMGWLDFLSSIKNGEGMEISKFYFSPQLFENKKEDKLVIWKFCFFVSFSFDFLQNFYFFLTLFA